ncbi:MAG: GtrA family protein [Oscillospiraceae bacterium]|nr:GtrA family protein [Oscillospiraceae bacterium]
MDRKKNVEEAVKYTLVGIGSTVIQYVAYALCYGLTHQYIPANIIGFILSVFNSYYWNRRVVFPSAKAAPWWKVLLKNYVLYFGTGVIATNLLSWLFIDVWGVSPYLSPVIIVLILYPINFLISKFWANKEEK